MTNLFESVFSEISSFVYRSRSDGDCLMLEMFGGVKNVLGYEAEDIVGNHNFSFVDLTHPDDKDWTFSKVDDAIAKSVSWDLVFRMRHASGEFVWIRERGSGVYEDGNLCYLQGLIVSAEDEVSARMNLEQLVTETKDSNREIIKLTSNITASIRALKMLSINARIEAARIGDDGLGFTIVAEEMKKLADQNAEWARVISEKITDMGGLSA